MQNSYILYTCFRSSASWRVRIALNIKKVPHEFKFINLGKGEQKSQEYKSINPNGTVPALVLPNGVILIQSMPILQYLQEVEGGYKLLPNNPIQKGLIRAICQFVNSGIHPYQKQRLSEKVYQDYGAHKKEFTQYWVNEGLLTLQHMLKKTKGKYCFGDQITMADLFVYPQIAGAVARFGVDLSKYPTIYQIYNQLKQIEAFVKAEPKNQPDFEK